MNLLRERPEHAAAVRWIEALALGLLAVVPVVPYFAFIVDTGVERFGLLGDFAWMEQATRHVFKGDTLLGPYSRFKWNHPGPFFFYLAAPFQALYSPASTGIYVATCLVTASAGVALVAMLRVLASRAHAIAGFLLVLAWSFAFGNSAANPWNPLIIGLPLATYLVAAALLARGHASAAFPAVVFGTLVGQHHVATVSTVVACGATAVVAYGIGARRRGWETKEKKQLAVAGALLLLLFLPPIVDQITSPVGNLTKVWRFFLSHPAGHSIGDAVHLWMRASSWLPDRVLGAELVDEGWVPIGMRWDAVPPGLPATARSIGIVQLLAAGAAAVVARRRRDVVSIALLGFGALSSFVAMLSLRSIVGESFHYLIFWTSATSAVAWLGVLSTALASVARYARREPGTVRALLVVLGVGMTLMVTRVQQHWLTKHPYPPASYPQRREPLRGIYAELRARVAAAHVTPVVHIEGAWDVGAAIVNELEKDRAEVRVYGPDKWNFVGVESDETVERPLHVYFATPPDPLPIAECLELVQQVGDITMYVAPHAVTSCPPKP